MKRDRADLDAPGAIQGADGERVKHIASVECSAYSLFFEKAGTIITSRRCPSDERERTDCAVQ